MIEVVRFFASLEDRLRAVHGRAGRIDGRLGLGEMPLADGHAIEGQNLMATGVRRRVVVPSPSCPESLCPQA